MAITFSKAFDVPAAAETFRYYGGWCTKLYGETNPSDPSMFNYTLREPVGVCGQIIPWNFPLLMAAWKSVRRWHAANHHPQARRADSATALRLGELILEAGLPEGVVNIITGFGTRRGQLDCRASRYRQGRLHRLDRSRQAHPARRRPEI